MNASELGRSLRKGERLTKGTELPIDQLIALQNFVGAAQDRLVSGGTDRNEGQKWPDSYHWFDAFLATPNGDFAIQITSYGHPEANSSTGLFVYISTITERDAQLIFSLQTPKTVFSVNNRTARKLSMYTPKQFDMVTALITQAVPIERGDYHAFIGGEHPQTA